MGSAAEVMTQGQDQFDQRLHVTTQWSLVRDPGFGVGKRLEDAPAMTRGSRDNPLVDQEQENRGRMPERHARPVVRLAEVVFQVQTDIPRSLFKKRCEMLVIAMGAVVTKPARPGLAKFTSEWFKHGMPSPQGPLVIERPERLALIPLLDHYIYPDKTQVAKMRHRD